MKIGVWLTTPVRFDPAKVDETPFGGAERSALSLAEKLATDHQVTVFANCDPGKVGDINYRPYHILTNQSIPAYVTVDTLIIVRADQNVLNPRRMDVRQYATKVILWTGDAYDQPNNQIFHDKFCLKQLDLICTKSHWQRETLLRHFPLLDPDKMIVMYNGVPDDIPESTYPTDPKFVYASTAFRGLHRFLDIWPLIKKRIPEATLDCYCKKKLYMGSDDSDNEFRGLYAKLERLEGIVIKEPLPQKPFHVGLTNYAAMLYPNCGFPESSCGVALEAMAIGMPVIASQQAGLIETLSMGHGYTVEGDPESQEYVNNFVDRVEIVYRTQVANWNRKSRKNLLANYSWSKVAQSWQNLLSSLIHTTENHSSPPTEPVALDSLVCS